MLEYFDLQSISTQLTSIATKNSSQAIYDKIRTTKAQKDQEATIQELEEIIRDLITEKNELIQIAQTYDEEVISQKISEEDIEYISHNLIPLLEKFLETDEEAGDGEAYAKAEDNLKNLENIKPLLSKKTITILQLLGFNYKRAIGEPLTVLVNSLITSQIPESSERLKVLAAERDLEYLKIMRDEAAYERMLESQK
ncbi:hypothetical protein [Halobacillus sp. Cin3]|uniref:hypothetical protein n=1 Tax=Halobacillus sp. Cin3 TaxID=2928441 RepID=UPI00248DB8B9|nr:hypothetical protein [Halobacillus sp. Cin3]